MPLLAILLDAIAFGGYFVQDHNRTHTMFVTGFVVQLVVTVLLLIMVFAYRGPRTQRHDYNLKGWRYRDVVHRQSRCRISLLPQSQERFRHYFPVRPCWVALVQSAL
jgi:hypothetical protein